MRAELYLIVEAGPEAGDRLTALLARFRPASVLIVPQPGAGLDARALAPLVAAIQRAGAAALILDDARLARTVKADGVHLTWTAGLEQAYRDAREMLGARGIVGAEAGTSRHDAMTLGEVGADYVAFRTQPDRPDGTDLRDDLVGWWAEIFEVPCVAFDVETAEDAQRLVDGGAEFLAVQVRAGATLAAELDRVAGIVAIMTEGVPLDAGTP